MNRIVGNKIFLTTAGVCILLMPVPSWSDTDYSFGGFVKADALWSDHSDQQRSVALVGDDFYVPSQAKVGDGSGDYDTVFDAHIKHSRIWFKTVAKTDKGTIKAYIETDFN